MGYRLVLLEPGVLFGPGFSTKVLNAKNCPPGKFEVSPPGPAAGSGIPTANPPLGKALTCDRRVQESQPCLPSRIPAWSAPFLVVFLDGGPGGQSSLGPGRAAMVVEGLAHVHLNTIVACNPVLGDCLC